MRNTKKEELLNDLSAAWTIFLPDQKAVCIRISPLLKKEFKAYCKNLCITPSIVVSEFLQKDGKRAKRGEKSERLRKLFFDELYGQKQNWLWRKEAAQKLISATKRIKQIGNSFSHSRTKARKKKGKAAQRH